MAISILTDANDNELSTSIVAIHAALVPTANGGAAIVYFGTNDEAWLFDPDAPEKPPVKLGTKPGWWAFCAGHAFLQDGRWVIAGGVVNQNVDHHGHDQHDSGERRCEMYSPLAGTFSPIADLNFQPGANHGGGRWYPTVVTLSNGEVFAVGGHPFSGKKVPNPDWSPDQPDPDNPPKQIDDKTGTDDYAFPPDPFPRHNNNTPERYSPGSNKWTLLTAESTSHANGSIDEYGRMHLAPSGHVFFSTIAKEDLRFYDPYTGKYDGTSVAPADSDYHRGSDFCSVVLPILPGDLKNTWVLACGSDTTQKINITADTPAWETAGASPLGKARNHACAVILPTGSVFLNAGEVDGGPLEPNAELYHPPIDWSGLNYQAGPGVWEQIEAPKVRRGYHGVALLMPDGRVWIAGSTWSDWDQNEKRMEAYTPPYIVPGRVKINQAPPSAGYGTTFQITLSSNTQISRAVLIRCGSVTHAFDSDQRYIVCNFNQEGTTLTINAPEGPGIAPPGNYMLFVLDSQLINGHGRPCERAAILRVCDQECVPVNNRSTYSKLEVDALKTNGEAVFPDAVWLFLENFRPHECNFPSNPTISLVWDTPTGPAVSANNISLDPQNPWSENATLPPDIAQRFTFRYDVHVHEDAYDNVPVQRDLFVRWDFGHFTCLTSLRLTTKPNPFMVDVAGGNPHWLSTDLRVFTVRADAAPPDGAPALSSGEAPLDYLEKVLDMYNSAESNAGHPFLQLSTDQDTSALELRKSVGGKALHNFAIAKVRYVAQGQDAEKVRVFFRMFNTVGTMLEFDSRFTYRRHGDGATATPLIGNIGPAIISLPFFEKPRVTPGKAMTEQPPDEARTIPAKGGQESVMYFGAWLDINQSEDHIPPIWIGDGPYNFPVKPLKPEPILALVRNYHQCLVAEVHFDDDPIPDEADPATQLPGTPANNDNLSQRNLAMVPVGNPGSVATRVAQTTFMARPSGSTPTAELVPVKIVPRREVLRTGRLRRRGPDELIFDGTKLPKGSQVTVFMPDVDADDVVMLAERRHSPVAIDKVDAHTVAFTLHSVAFLPMPGGRTAPIPGLISVELPEGVKAGQRYRLVVHQYSGKKRRIVGSFQLEVPVAHEPELLEGESIKLSILRWIFKQIPKTDVWYPIFERYLGQIADRVLGFGGDPDAIEPSPNGDGYPGAEINPTGRGTVLVGKIAEVRYDCFGDFIGFVLASCNETHAFDSRERPVEQLVVRACDQRLRLAIAIHPQNPRHFLSISVLCGSCIN